MARRRSAQAHALSRLRGLCEKSSAPLRGEFLRWVPDRLPLRCAPLQASGKARLRVWAQLSPPLSRAHAAKAECDPGPSARLRREAAPNSFRRGLIRLSPMARRGVDDASTAFVEPATNSGRSTDEGRNRRSRRSLLQAETNAIPRVRDAAIS